LENCIRYYDRNIQGYRCVMFKREFLDGKLRDPERVESAFREKPFSVYMRWLEGARLAERALYVRGENNGMMRIRPRFLNIVVSKDPDGTEAHRSGRYTIKEFGMKKGMENALDSWREAQKQHALHVEFLGEERLSQVGDRPCYK